MGVLQDRPDYTRHSSWSNGDSSQFPEPLPTGNWQLATGDHIVVRTNSVDEPVYSSLAIANGRIYIRAEKHLYAISLSPEP